MSHLAKLEENPNGQRTSERTLIRLHIKPHSVSNSVRFAVGSQTKVLFQVTPLYLIPGFTCLGYFMLFARFLWHTLATRDRSCSCKQYYLGVFVESVCMCVLGFCIVGFSVVDLLSGFSYFLSPYQCAT